MPQRKAKPKNYEAPNGRLVMRLLAVDSAAADMATKTVPVIIATETPVEMYDERTGVTYNEILDMDGGKVRGERDRLPIVDSHDRNTVRNVLGTIRNVRKEHDPQLGIVMRGEASFARDDDSQDAFEKLLDGHLEDFSITAIRNLQKRVAPNETYIHRGQPVVGPAVIVTDWTATDASLVAAGADENSRALVLRSRNSYREINRMLSDELKTMLVGLGLPEQITDADQALTYMAGLLSSQKPAAATPAPESVADATGRMEMEEKPEGEAVVEEEEKETERMDDKEKADEPVERKIQRAIKVERNRRREIEALCQKANVERALRDQLLNSECSLEIAREQVLKNMIERQQFVGGNTSDAKPRIEAGAGSYEKTQAAMRDGLVMRACRTGSMKRPEDFKPAEGAEDFSQMTLMRFAERFLREQGFNVDRMNGPDIARAAMGNRSVIDHYRSMGVVRDAYHTTGSFPQLMLNASNKTLLAGYTEYSATWKAWARQGASTSDLKPINRIRYSESGNPEEVPEGANYKERAMSDEKETYTPSKKGHIFTVSWETIINDDLDAISRTPQMHGNACARLVNRSVYRVLMTNPTMGDGKALFADDHPSGDNYVATSGAAPSVTTLNTAFQLMMLQKGLNSDVILGITPKFLIVSPSVSGAALELVNSVSYNASNNNSGVKNIYGVGGPRNIEVIVEPQLSTGTAAQWYMAADPSQIDTVEVTFLQGEETPQLDQEFDFDRDVYKYKVRQTFGAAAIDWRGLFSNVGS